MSERLLITKLVRDGDRADLYGRGHQWPDLKLFTLSDLADVGIEYANLENGEEVPCRFWAVYELSDKLNKAGNPYKDVITLEPIDAPATTTSTDNSAILAELRAIRKAVAALAVAIGGGALLPGLDDDGAMPFADESEEEPEPTGVQVDADTQAVLEQARRANGNGSELDEFLGPRPDVAPETVTRAAAEARNKGNGKPMEIPTSPKALVDHLAARGQTYAGAGELYHELRHKLGDQFPTWPQASDEDGWQRVTVAAEGL